MHLEPVVYIEVLRLFGCRQDPRAPEMIDRHENTHFNAKSPSIARLNANVLLRCGHSIGDHASMMP